MVWWNVCIQYFTYSNILLHFHQCSLTCHSGGLYYGKEAKPIMLQLPVAMTIRSISFDLIWWPFRLRVSYNINEHLIQLLNSCANGILKGNHMTVCCVICSHWVYIFQVWLLHYVTLPCQLYSESLQVLTPTPTQQLEDKDRGLMHHYYLQYFLQKSDKHPIDPKGNSIPAV